MVVPRKQFKFLFFEDMIVPLKNKMFKLLLIQFKLFINRDIVVPQEKRQLPQGKAQMP
jgi:hypothetical protein